MFNNDPFPRVLWTLIISLCSFGLLVQCQEAHRVHHGATSTAAAALVGSSSGALEILTHNPPRPNVVIAATGEDQTDQIQAALDFITERGGGSLTFRAGGESGLILLRKDAVYSYALKTKASNFTWRCEGGVTFKRMPWAGANNQKDFSTLWLEDAHDVRFENCNWDGGVREFPQGEQSHIIDVRANRAEVYNIWVSGNDFAWYEGDAVRLLGNASPDGPLVRDVYIDGNSMHDNLRSGVGIQRAVQHVSITNNKCWNCSDQCIDFEPSGKNSKPVTDILIAGNWFGPNQSLALTVAGTKRQSDIELRAARRIMIEGNVFLGGVNIIWARDVRLSGNIIEAQRSVMLNKVLPDGRLSEVMERRDGNKTASVLINGEVQRVYINNNTITQKAPPEAKKFGIDITRAHGDVIRGVSVIGNHIMGPEGRGLAVRTAEDVLISDNVIEGGTVLEAENAPAGRHRVQNNRISDKGTCLRLRGRDHGLLDILINGNLCYGDRMFDSKGKVEGLHIGQNWGSP